MIAVEAIFLLLASLWCMEALANETTAITNFMKSLNPSFNQSGSYCDWQGIHCDARNQSIIEIQLTSYGLHGVIPNSSIGKLSALRQLNLFNNSIYGTVPRDIWKLSNLTYLNLASNGFNATLSILKGNASPIQRLDLSNNKFTGAISSQFCFLGNLSNLNLSSSGFGSVLMDSFINCTSLEVLDLSNNMFNGSFPHFSNSSKLEKLCASNSNFTGEVFQKVWSVGSLSILRLDHNKLTGDLPNISNASIKELNLSNNQFNGSISSVFEQWSSLEILDVSSNNLSASAGPLNLSNFSQLRHVNMADNPYLNARSLEISEAKHLEFINVSSTGLGGSINNSIGELMNLSLIDLSRNNINGGIPESIVNLALLEYLDLSYNSLSGEIPSGIENLVKLDHVNLSHNNLSGSVSSDFNNRYGSNATVGNDRLCIVICTSTNTTNNTTNSAGMSSHSHLSTGGVIGVVLGSLIGISGLCVVVILCKRNWSSPKKLKEEKHASACGPYNSELDPSIWATGIKDPTSIPVVVFEKPLSNLTFSDLLSGTFNFSKDCQVAESDYGTVFKGTLPGDIQIAITIIGKSTGGPQQLESLGKLKHVNLVPLLGYCVVGIEKLLLYKYFENGDLHSKLHELPEGIQNTEDWTMDTWEQPEVEFPKDHLSWPTRHKIALGTARALSFLHHGCSPPIVHSSVKSSNILLDAEYEPHLAATGIARLLAMKEGEYKSGDIKSKDLSAKGDVYSFGIVLFELATGKENYAGKLINWVRTLVCDKRSHRALDPRLSSEESTEEMLEMLRIAYLCTAECPSKRPTMQQVVGLLKDLKKNQATS